MITFIRSPFLFLAFFLTLSGCEKANDVNSPQKLDGDTSVTWIHGDKDIEKYVDPKGEIAVVAYFTNAWDLPGRIVEKTLDDEIAQIFDPGTTVFVKYDCTDTTGVAAKVHSNLGPQFIPLFTSNYSGSWKFSPPLDEWFRKEVEIQKALNSIR